MPFTPGTTNTEDGGTGTSDSGRGLHGESTNQAGVFGISANFVGVWGESQNPQTAQVGVFGKSPNGQGVHGESTNQAGVFGISANFVGVWGESQNPQTAQVGVFGKSPNGQGVHGESTNQAGVFGTSTNNNAVWGDTPAQDRAGVFGESRNNRGGWGVFGKSNFTGVHGEGLAGLILDPNQPAFGVAGVARNGAGVAGLSSHTNYGGVAGKNTEQGGPGVQGQAYGLNGMGVWGRADVGPQAVGVAGFSSSGLAGFFSGNVVVSKDLTVSGTLTAAVKLFKIDHPSDPANKYLIHAVVESPEMVNVYSGNVTTDHNGEATVHLPHYVEALNADFRYQLTAIGQFAQAIVDREIHSSRFMIKTDKPNVRVSWQVTGLRQDNYAKAHPVVVEQDKNIAERGLFLHPEVHGENEQKRIQALPSHTLLPNLDFEIK
jgi:hypothetical protein